MIETANNRQAIRVLGPHGGPRVFLTRIACYSFNSLRKPALFRGANMRTIYYVCMYVWQFLMYHMYILYSMYACIYYMYDNCMCVVFLYMRIHRNIHIIYYTWILNIILYMQYLLLSLLLILLFIVCMYVHIHYVFNTYICMYDNYMYICVCVCVYLFYLQCCMHIIQTYI